MIEAQKHLRDMMPYRLAASSLEHLALVPEVQFALEKLTATNLKEAVLIGGLAMSLYAKPRYTEDIDMLFMQVPESVPHFTRVRAHAFQERETHVQLEALTPEFLKLPISLAKMVLATSVDVGGLKVASREGLIALKLVSSEQAGRIRKDEADIETLLLTDTLRLVLKSEWRSELSSLQLSRLTTIYNDKYPNRKE